MRKDLTSDRLEVADLLKTPQQEHGEYRLGVLVVGFSLLRVGAEVEQSGVVLRTVHALHAIPGTTYYHITTMLVETGEWTDNVTLCCGRRTCPCS